MIFKGYLSRNGMTRTDKSFKTEEDVRDCYRSLEDKTKEHFDNYTIAERDSINYARKKVLD
jgi:hypothetical protein